MKPNLKQHNATSLQFSAIISLTDELISAMRKVSSPDDEGDSPFFDSYKGHRAWVWAIDIDKDVESGLRRFRFEFNYEVAGGFKLRKQTPRIEQLMELLSSNREELNFYCRTSFQFGRRLKPRPIISLPMKYIELPDMPFDRIQGLHLVKLDGNDTKYEIILDVPSIGLVVENVLFSYISTIDESLANKILIQAVTISDNFVLLER